MTDEPVTQEPEATTEPEAPAGVDLGPVMSRIDELGQQVGEFAQQLRPNEEPEPEPDQYQDPYQDPYGGYDPDQVAEQQAQQELQRWLDSAINKGVQEQIKQHVDPLRESIEQERWETAIADLEDRYTDLQDEKTAEAVFAEAQRLAEGAGRPELAKNPEFFETVYLAGQARSRAGQETPAGTSQGPGLEPAGGANSPGEEQPDHAQRILGIAQAQQGVWRAPGS